MMSLSCDWPKCLFTITLALSQLIEEQGQQAKLLSWACTLVCTLVPNEVRLSTWRSHCKSVQVKTQRVPSTRLIFVSQLGWGCCLNITHYIVCVWPCLSISYLDLADPYLPIHLFKCRLSIFKSDIFFLTD